MGDKPCTVLLHYDKGEPPNVAELKSQIETGSLEDKIAALKKTILLLSNGEKLPQVKRISSMALEWMRKEGEGCCW